MTSNAQLEPAQAAADYDFNENDVTPPPSTIEAAKAEMKPLQSLSKFYIAAHNIEVCSEIRIKDLS